MANVLVNDGYLSDIADSIRAKNGSSDTYTPAEMSTAIDNLPSGITYPVPTERYAPAAIINVNTYYPIWPCVSTSNRQFALENACLPLVTSATTSTFNTNKYVTEIGTNYKRPCPMVFDMCERFGSNVSIWDSMYFGWLANNPTITDYYFTNTNTSWQSGDTDAHKYAICGTGLFACCTSLKEIHYIDTPVVPHKIFNYKLMFYYCSSLEELTFGNIFTPVTWATCTNGAVENYDFTYMFAGCSKLKRLDLSVIDTSAVQTSTLQCSYMFYNCKQLEFLDVRNIEFSRMTSSSMCFGRYQSNTVKYFKADCTIIVKDATEKTAVLTMNAGLTNVYTVAEAIAAGIIES